MITLPRAILKSRKSYSSEAVVKAESVTAMGLDPVEGFDVNQGVGCEGSILFVLRGVKGVYVH